MAIGLETEIYNQPPTEAVKTGVCLIILQKPTLNQFLTIEELTSSCVTNKVAGQRSAPMESTDPGEIFEQTRARILIEEVRLLPSDSITFPEMPLGWYQASSGVWVRIDLGLVPNDCDISLGTATDEVSNPMWTPVDEVFKNSSKFRPGNYEALLSSKKFLVGELLKPDIYYCVRS